MRSIRKIHQAEYRPIADLITYSPLPTRALPQLDPFLFLNHHGHQVYPPHNHGLPFGPHPHRGMETVTFIVEGDIMHKDSEGYQSVITTGGVQWMTAGRGLIHAETSSDTFKNQGGELEILQLWVNLPARLKMTQPHYVGLNKDQIPAIEIEAGVTLNLIAGTHEGQKSAFEPLTDIFLSTLNLSADARWTTTIPAPHQILLYVVRGSLAVNGQEVQRRHLVEFNQDGEELVLEARQDSLLIFGHALPFNEPIIANGPFVMNTEREIAEAYQDYRQGKFGTWQG